MYYRVEKDLMQIIVDYLARRPYAEVFQIMGAIQALPIEEEKEVKNVKKS